MIEVRTEMESSTCLAKLIELEQSSERPSNMFQTKLVAQEIVAMPETTKEMTIEVSIGQLRQIELELS